jgi:hypothetical protein
MDMGRRIRIVERPAKEEDPQLRWNGPIRPRQTLIVGREGDLAIATNPVDRKVSRHAVTITASDRGWSILPTNRNGVRLHPWAQPSHAVSTLEIMMWPRVGVRVVGHADMEHWVLLEDDEAYTKGAARHTTGLTEYAPPPTRLTDKQTQALRLVFRDLLAWPPRSDPEVHLIKQAAKALEISSSGVQERLKEVLHRAHELGLARRDVGLTDPEYLYALARAGYVQPSPVDLHRPLHPH